MADYTVGDYTEIKILPMSSLVLFTREGDSYEFTFLEEGSLWNLTEVVRRGRCVAWVLEITARIPQNVRATAPEILADIARGEITGCHLYLKALDEQPGGGHVRIGFSQMDVRPAVAKWTVSLKDGDASPRAVAEISVRGVFGANMIDLPWAQTVDP